MLTKEVENLIYSRKHNHVVIQVTTPSVTAARAAVGRQTNTESSLFHLRITLLITGCLSFTYIKYASLHMDTIHKMHQCVIYWRIGYTSNHFIIKFSIKADKRLVGDMNYSIKG